MVGQAKRPFMSRVAHRFSLAEDHPKVQRSFEDSLDEGCISIMWFDGPTGNGPDCLVD
jgi:hypothetical protein